ncbi:GspE/PulE family protein [Bradyrhizobium sp. Arg237L]|uniref:GspE/PulE family protein n=1 Tax=Bradyrhizobium sp. Arg237L TaxID=3003352 RepID=UPI00249DAF82|nr:GspE/PulE family protein [Bradyrhizobium sp. Arg237L]MDI4235732.1 GspE/PulE family protein [Bradyrhizobium sp. Arg237L]
MLAHENNATATAAVPPNDFMTYLAGRGALRDGQREDGARRVRNGDGSAGHTDWSAVTRLTPSALADELASFYRCDRVRRDDLVEGRFAGGEMSTRFLKEERLFPYATAAGTLRLAVAAPIDDETLRAVELALRRPIVLAVATADDLEAALSLRLEPDQPSDTPQIGTGAGEDDLDNLRDLARGAPVVRALDDLLRLAVEQRATDLHIEPAGNALQVRLRVDGMLKNVPAPPMSMAKGILSRLKILASLNITERRLAQDGRAHIVVSGSEIDLRVATMPTMHGECAVIRLLRKGAGLVSLDQIGLSARDETILRKALLAPYGMVIVTGPTGSGKTTTLAASLAVINEPTRKIVTIEDPVEYQISGINQTQVHPGIGLTFASALRSFMRLDPDVIMVGEMRDSETAHIGVHAALTGHLVLTTLHTNTAAGAITRLIDMGIESFLLASCARVIVAQRLVRILCDHCKESHSLSAADIAADERYAALGIEAGEVVCRPKGCDWCGFTGFRGRKGVFEIMEIGTALRRSIGPKTDSTDLETAARREGMTTMTEDGINKLRAGQTTLDEIFRLTTSL